MVGLLIIGFKHDHATSCRCCRLLVLNKYYVFEFLIGFEDWKMKPAPDVEQL